MAVSFFKLKKWTMMVLGKSVYHVNQGPGRCYSVNSLEGYYNDLTEKVLKYGREDNQVPSTTVDTGETVFFSIAIFQYGLAAYDLYLLSEKKDINQLLKAIECADWAIKNQMKNGGWVTFAFENSENPYSSMAQGEAISLLLRVYNETKKEIYKEAAQKSLDFMLLPIEKGGTTKYVGNNVFLYEYPNDSLVLNGWIFSIWGLMDYCKVIDAPHVKKILSNTLETLENNIDCFDNSYWSLYDKKKISSPFYHKLHIAQLSVMYVLTGKRVFRDFEKKWDNYQKRWSNRTISFVKKALQKITE